MQVTKVRQNVHSLLLDLRNLQTLVESDTFEEALCVAVEADKTRIEKSLNDCSSPVTAVRSQAMSELKEVIRRLTQDEENMRSLRAKARELRIPHYGKMIKSSLLSEIALRTEGNGHVIN